MVDALIKNATAYRMRSPSDIFLDNSLAVIASYLKHSGLEIVTEDLASISHFKSITDNNIANRVNQLIIEGKTKSEEYFALQLKQEQHLKNQMLEYNNSIATRLRDEKIGVFGEKTFFGDAWTNSKELYKLIREKSPETLIVAGGHHASVWREKIFQDSGADFFVVGPGEHTLKQIIEVRKNSKDKKSAIEKIISLVNDRKIKNTMYIDEESKIKLSGLLPVNATPNNYPCYDQNMENGLFPISNGKNNLHIIVDSLGCFWNLCVPCCHKHNILYYHERDPKSFVDEIEYFTKKGIGIFRKGGSGAKIEHQEKCAREIIKRNLNINYSSFMRAEPNAKEKNNELVETYKLLIESGLRAIGMGGESGSKVVNEYLKKGVSPDDVKYTIEAMQRASHSAGVDVDVILYMIYPTAIPDSINQNQVFAENLKFVKDVQPTSVVVSPEGAFYGSELYSEMKKYGIHPGENFDKIMPQFEYTTFLPKEYWKKIDYSIGELSFEELLNKTSELAIELKKSGIIIDCTDEQVVFARGAGFKGKEGLEKFYNNAVLDLVSCKYDFLESASKKFNETSRAIALKNTRL